MGARQDSATASGNNGDLAMSQGARPTDQIDRGASRPTWWLLRKAEVGSCQLRSTVKPCDLRARGAVPEAAEVDGKSKTISVVRTTKIAYESLVLEYILEIVGLNGNLMLRTSDSRKV